MMNPRRYMFLIEETMKHDNYDIHNLKSLFESFFHSIRNSYWGDKNSSASINVYMRENPIDSAFNETDYRVATEREDLKQRIYADHWGWFITNFKVRARLDLDILFRKDDKGDTTLTLSGFQKRMVRDKEETGASWTYYSHVFENHEKTEVMHQIDNDETCEVTIEEATLSDFLLFKDKLAQICDSVDRLSTQ